MIKIENLKRLVALRFPGMPAEVTQADGASALVMLEVSPGHKQGTFIDLSNAVKAGEQVFNLCKSIRPKAA